MNWHEDQRSDGVVEGRRDRYEAIKRHLAEPGKGPPLTLHAFTYAFLGSAKNVDLFVDADDTEIRDRLLSLRESLLALEAFEREGTDLPKRLGYLRNPYLRLRRVMLRPSARDERRTLAHLLMTGPATPAELVAALELPSPSGAARALLALAPVVVRSRGAARDRFEIDDALLPVALFAVRERMGIDPLAVLFEAASMADTQ